MKHAGKIAACLVGGLVLSATLRADDSVIPGNPYAPIVARNIFDLKMPTPPAPTAPQADANPPPKITPNGITDILGEWQVIFTVGGVTRRGKPAGNQCYLLTEGERQDDIEVVKIDNKMGVVIFNNHGVVQELPLADASTGAGINSDSATVFTPYGFNSDNQYNRYSHGGGDSIPKRKMTLED